MPFARSAEFYSAVPQSYTLLQPEFHSAMLNVPCNMPTESRRYSRVKLRATLSLR